MNHLPIYHHFSAHHILEMLSGQGYILANSEDTYTDSVYYNGIVDSQIISNVVRGQLNDFQEECPPFFGTFLNMLFVSEERLSC